MPPKDRVKKSVRLDPDAITIIDAYATTHSCSDTEALNAIILSFTHTYTQMPPISATQDSQAQWQRAIENRLTKLETAIQLSPITATQDKTQLSLNQVIDSRSKLYQQLWNSFEASQKIDRKEYYLSNKLGIVCRVINSPRAVYKKFKVVDCFQGKQVVINDDGTFLFMRSDGNVDWNYQELEPTTAEALSPVESLITLTGDAALDIVLRGNPKKLIDVGLSVWLDGWLWLQQKNGDITRLFEYPEVLFDELNSPSLATISELKASMEEYKSKLEKPTSALGLSSDKTAIEATAAVIDSANLLPPTDAIQVPPTGLPMEALLDRFATKLNNPGQMNTLRLNLPKVGLKKIEAGWTAQYDPDGLTWVPESVTRETWVAQPNPVDVS